jgi:hypothetical protein
MTTVYRKRWGFAPNPAVAREIASLDARADCQRIVHLLSAYEFPWDLSRALELALFYTYGSASVSRLLDRTREFADHGQKRYDDTRLLIAHLMQSGWDGDIGRRALARMNGTHANYPSIPNDDFVFVLWTFIDFPLRWTRAFSYRSMTPHEQLAWFHFWTELGQRMGIQDLPTSKAALDAWVEAYCQRAFVAGDPASARVAQATVDIMRAWLPRGLRWTVAPVAYSLFAKDPRFLAAVSARGSLLLGGWVSLALRGLGWLKKIWAIGPYPYPVDAARNRSYPDNRYRIEDLAPDKHSRH